MRKKIAANYIAYLIITGFFLAISYQSSAQIINTFAGNGTPGYSGDGGQPTDAELYHVVGVAVDDTGNLYIADAQNGAIRKVSALTGKISTIAGIGSNGYNGDGMAATVTQLNNPQQLAIDDSGNIYIAEYGNEIIRKITASTGIINTVAGTPTVWSFSGDGGPATAAKLSVVTGVALDDSGNIYIADQWNHRVRRVTKATGIINTIAGTGASGFNGNGIAATTAELAYPTEIAVDDSGNVYFTDSWNNEIRKITKQTGIITDYAGNETVSTGLGSGGYSGDGGQATASQLNYPNGMYRDDSGNIYIADWYNQVIRKVSAVSGIIYTVAGDGYGKGGSNGGYAGDGGPATNAELNAPEGIVMDKCGNLYIGDMFNNRVRIVSGPPGTVKVLPVNPLICYGGSDTLNASGGGSYHWSPITGLSDTTGSVVIANPTITTTYIITGNGGCSGVVTPDTIVVTVNPPQSLIILPQSPSVCGGQPVTLTADTTGKNYTWSPAIGLNATTGDSVVANPTALTVYTVTGLDSIGCFTTATDTVKINSPAPLNITPPSPATECNGEGIVLSVPASGSNYIWSPATGLSATTGSTVTANPTAGITYMVTGLDSLGCAVSATEVINIQLGPSKPIITISVTGDTLISSAINGNQWFLNGTAIHGATDSIFVIKSLPSNDSVTVSVTNVANGCSTTSDLFITGIDPLELNKSWLSIYPNPTNGNTKVDISPMLTGIKDWNLQLINLLGQTLYTIPSLSYTNEIDLSNLPGGIYFITILNKTSKAVFPIVKQTFTF